jgi:hypothetical protein
MSYRAALYDSLCAVIAAHWPAVTGICRTSASSRRSVDERVRTGALPFAAVEFGLAPSGEWGIANKSDAGEVFIYYVAADETEAESIEALCEALADYLYANNRLGSVGEVIGKPEVPDPKGVPLTEYFLSTQRPFNAGVVVPYVVVSETT